MRILVLFLLTLPLVAAQETGIVALDKWQATVSLETPDEIIEFDLHILNKGDTEVLGLTIPIYASSTKYIVEEGKFASKNAPTIKISQNGEFSNVNIELFQPLRKGANESLRIRLRAEGTIRASEKGYIATIKFGKPSALVEGGKEGVEIVKGTIRVHLPVGDLPVGYEPAPWREIWQGVSGFEDHFVAIYDNTPFTQEIKITFKEEPLLREIIEADNDVEKLVYKAGLKEKKGEDTTVAQVYIDKAKIALGKAIDSLLAQDKENAETELKAAKRYINTAQATLGIKETTTTTETETKKETPIPSYTELQGISKYAIFSTIFFGLVVLAFVGSYVIGTLGVEGEEED
jgi:hypothetical protein